MKFFGLFLIIVFSFALLSMSIVQNAEARGADEPCSYLKPHLYTKDASGNCVRTSMVPVSSDSPVTSRSVNEPCSYLNPTKYTRDPQTGLCHKVTVSPPTPQTTTTQNIDYRTAPTTTIATATNGNTSQDVLFSLDPENLKLSSVSDDMISDSVIEVSQTLLMFGAPVILGLLVYKKWKSRRTTRITKYTRKQFNQLSIIQRLSPDQQLTRQQIQSIREMELTRQQIQRIREMERRFVQMRYEDPDFLLLEFGAKLKNYSKRGNELYETKTLIPNRTIKLLKYVDPSTDRIYLCFVPDTINRADEGMAWKFSISEEDYHNLAGEA